MPNHRKHRLPSEQMVEVLAQCRREGLAFDEAWLLAVGTRAKRGRVTFPHPTDDRRSWKLVFAATREEWRAAYERRDSALSSRLALVVQVVLERDDVSREARAVRRDLVAA